MPTKSSRAFALTLLLAMWALLPLRAGDEPPRTGPGSETRFPPLKIPPGFKATLFACDPMVEYPSAIAAGPRAGLAPAALARTPIHTVPGGPTRRCGTRRTASAGERVRQR